MDLARSSFLVVFWGGSNSLCIVCGCTAVTVIDICILFFIMVEVTNKINKQTNKQHMLVQWF